MSTKDQAWAERVGREAVELGFPAWEGMRYLRDLGESVIDGALMSGPGALPWRQEGNEAIPDFRDRLTELACIAWVEDVAREACQAVGSISFHFDESIGKHWVVINGDTCGVGDTLAEACIAAVRTMKGGE